MKKRFPIISILIIIGLLAFLLFIKFNINQTLIPTITKTIYSYQEAITAIITQTSSINRTLYPENTETVLPFTLTPTPTNTLSPTLTLTPSTTPRPTLISSIIQNLPELDYDLIWFYGDWEYRYSQGWGEIRLLDTKNNSIKILVGSSNESIVQIEGEVISYQLNSEQNLLIYITREIENISEHIIYKISILSLNELTNEIVFSTKPIVSEIGNPFEEVKISQNGEWIALILNKYLDFPNEWGNFEKTGSEFFLINTVRISNSLQIDDCNINYLTGHKSVCHSSLIWAPNSDQLAYHGEDGLWTIDLEGNKEKIIQDIIYPNDARNSITYYPISWSSFSDLIIVEEWHWEAFIKGILNIESKVFEILEITPWYYGAPETTASWLKDGRLIVEFNPNIFVKDITHPDLYVYELNNSGNSIISKESKIELKEKFWERIINNVPMEDGRFRFVTIQGYNPLVTGEYPPSGILDYSVLRLYDININQYNYFEIGSINIPNPIALPDGVTWNIITFTPSAEWAILNQYFGEYGYLYLLSFDNDEIYLISHLVDENACCFEWIEN